MAGKNKGGREVRKPKQNPKPKGVPTSTATVAGQLGAAKEPRSK